MIVKSAIVWSNSFQALYDLLFTTATVRHPHVFGTNLTSDQLSVIRQWQRHRHRACKIRLIGLHESRRLSQSYLLLNHTTGSLYCDLSDARLCSVYCCRLFPNLLQQLYLLADSRVRYANALACIAHTTHSSHIFT